MLKLISLTELEERHFFFHFYVRFYLSPLYGKEEAISCVFPNSDINFLGIYRKLTICNNSFPMYDLLLRA